MNARISVFAITAILVASVGMTPIFGQGNPGAPVFVTTDKDSYDYGDTIIVNGTVRDLFSGANVGLKIIANNGNVAELAQLEVGQDKTFGTSIVAGGSEWRTQGTYTVEATYGITGDRASTGTATFEFSGADGGDSDGNTLVLEGSPDSISWTITGGSIESITPNPDAKSLTIAITTTSDGELVITLPRTVIDAKLGDADDDFFVLVDGEESDSASESATTDAARTLTIPFSNGAEDIEIIGTFVIPEFGTIAVLVLAVAIVSIIAVSARSRLSIMPKY